MHRAEVVAGGKGADPAEAFAGGFGEIEPTHLHRPTRAGRAVFAGAMQREEIDQHQVARLREGRGFLVFGHALSFIGQSQSVRASFVGIGRIALAHGRKTTFVRADAKLNGAKFVRHRNQWTPKNQAIQTAKLRGIILMPSGAKFFLSGIVNPNTITARRNGRRIRAAHLPHHCLVFGAGHEANERRDLFRRIINHPAQGAVVRDEGLIACVECPRRKVDLLDGELVLFDEQTDYRMDAALHGFHFNALIKIRQHHKTIAGERGELFICEWIAHSMKSGKAASRSHTMASAMGHSI